MVFRHRACAESFNTQVAERSLARTADRLHRLDQRPVGVIFSVFRAGSWDARTSRADHVTQPIPFQFGWSTLHSVFCVPPIANTLRRSTRKAKITEFTYLPAEVQLAWSIVADRRGDGKYLLANGDTHVARK
jgi:hypothetical protein